MAGHVRENPDGPGGIIRIRDAMKPADHNKVVSLDDLDRDIIEMRQKDVTFSTRSWQPSGE